jgi:hypothetical protein
MIDIDDLKPWLTALLVVLATGIAWYFLLQYGNTRIEARCLANGGKILQRPGQVSYCLAATQVTAVNDTSICAANVVRLLKSKRQ